MKLKRLDSRARDFEASLAVLTAWEASNDEAVDAAVRAILDDVRRRGDAALLEYTLRFDGVDATSVAALEVSRAGLGAALAAIDAAEREALQEASDRVRRYHERQRTQGFTLTEADGSTLAQRVLPIDRVGIYVPGGKASYPSSVIMNAVPAKVAGVREIVMVSPTPRGEVNPLVLAAAALAGVDRVFTVGGAQAIGALAYGTVTIPKVDKITGPGNAYVAAAKRRVFGEVGIDMIAGPSEVLVIADGSTPPGWIVMDLFAQAEHDEAARVWVVSPDDGYLDAIEAGIERLLPSMARRSIIEKSLAAHGALISARNLEDACAISNRIAPEHLGISVERPAELLPAITSAGSVFLGRYSSEALGDYCAGPNHVLPTGGTARFASPLGVHDFQKRQSVVTMTKEGARALAPLAARLARSEGLLAHARAAMIRLETER